MDLNLNLLHSLSSNAPGKKEFAGDNFITLTQELNWLLLPTRGALPDPGIKPASLACPVLAGGFFTTSSTWEVLELSGGLVKKRFLDL